MELFYALALASGRTTRSATRLTASITRATPTQPKPLFDKGFGWVGVALVMLAVSLVADRVVRPLASAKA